MELCSLGITGVASITVICFLAGQAVKATGLPNKWIPLICGSIGGILGIIGLHLMPDFPATDYITAAAVGITSGLAATGGNELYQKLLCAGGSKSCKAPEEAPPQ